MLYSCLRTVTASAHKLDFLQQKSILWKLQRSKVQQGWFLLEHWEGLRLLPLSQPLAVLGNASGSSDVGYITLTLAASILHHLMFCIDSPSLLRTLHLRFSNLKIFIDTFLNTIATYKCIHRFVEGIS